MSSQQWTVIEEIATTPRTVIVRVKDHVRQKNLVFKHLRASHPNPFEIARLRQEYTILEAIDSERVVQTFGLERIGDQYGILMEEFGETNLGELLAREPQLSLEDRLSLALELARAIRDVHDSGYIHRDINPRNVLVRRSDLKIKMIDFSIAAPQHRSEQGPVNEKSLEGSLPYLAPEQTGRMNRDVDYRADFYSCGVTLFELFTGRLPFEAEDLLGYVHAHIAKRPPVPSRFQAQIPRSLDGLILKLLEKNAEDRYQSTYGIISDIETMISQLRDQGQISSFALAQHDVNETFRISPVLYGRERERTVLLDAFDQVSREGLAFVLVSGYSGIGKSALVHEVDKPIVARRGFFVSGKFDQFQRNQGLSALVKAMETLFEQLLLRPGAEVDRVKQRLHDELGSLVEFAADLLAPVATLLGAKPHTEHLSSSEASRRSILSLVACLRAFGKEGLPVALFIDDLQWSDQATLEFLRELALARDVHHILVIGSYRNNEVLEGHPLLTTLDDLERQRPYTHLELKPLALRDTQKLLSDSLYCQETDTEALAAVVHKQAEGNPFYIIEMLKDLHDKKILTFDRSLGRWQWNMKDVAAHRVSDNLVDFMMQRLTDLPTVTREALSIAACIGHTFDLRLMARSLNIAIRVIVERILPAIERQLIVPMRDDYRLILHSDFLTHEVDLTFRFRHDRIQQAFDAFWKEDQRAEQHLRLARLLSQDPPSRRRTMDMASHYVEAASLVHDDDEIYNMLEAWIEAAKIAKTSNSYENAYKLLQLARSYMPKNYWQTGRTVALNIHQAFAETAFLTRRFEEASLASHELLEQQISLQDRLQVLYGLVFQYAVQGKSAACLEYGIKTLMLCGIKVPRNPHIAHVLQIHFRIKRYIRKHGFKSLLEAPEVEDPVKRLILKLIFEVLATATNSGQHMLMGYTIMLATELSLRFGPCSETAYALVCYSTVINTYFNDTALGKRAAEVGLEVLNRLQTSNLRGRTLGCYANFVHSWHFPARENVNYLKKALDASYEEGDLFWLAAMAVSIPWSTQGITVQDVQSLQKKYIAISQSTGHREFIEFGRLALGFAYNLSGSSVDPMSLSFVGFDEQECVDGLERDRMSMTLIFYYMNKMEVALTSGNISQGLDFFEKAQRHEKALQSLVSEFDYRVISVMLLTRAGGSRIKTAIEIKRRVQFAKRWARYNPGNFSFAMHLMQAEEAAWYGKTERAMRLYDKAIEDSQQLGNLRQEALAYQAAFEFYVRAGLKRQAQGYLKQCLQLLQHWGAYGRSEVLKKRFPDLVGTELPDRIPVAASTLHGTFHGSVHASPMMTTSTVSNLFQAGSMLDAATLIKASQALMGEMRLDRLVSKLSDTLIENAGADRAVLILREASSDRYQIPLLEQNVEGASTLKWKDFEVTDDLPVALIRSVIRSRKMLLLHDAGTAAELAKDPYIEHSKPCSVLAIPMLHQGHLKGVIYLENRLSRGAFTKERTQIVELLSTQAAVSIDNASLYHQLEQRVIEKTRDIRSILGNIQQGVFMVSGSGLIIHEEYSPYLHSLFPKLSIAGNSVRRLLLEPAGLHGDQLALIETALRSSIGEDTLAFQLNEAHLPRELHLGQKESRRILEVDWHPILGEAQTIEKLLIVVRDVTSLRALQEESAQKRGELEMISELLQHHPATQARFFAETADLVRRSLRDAEGLDLRRLGQQLHTLKGLARSLQLSRLASAIHRAEDALGQSDLPMMLQDIGAALDAYQTQQRRLGRWEGVAIEAQALTSYLQGFDALVADAAQNLGKTKPTLSIAAPELMLSGAGQNLLDGVLTHLLRNALDHSIEKDEIRKLSKKTSQPKLVLDAQIHGPQLVLKVEDDGRGLDLARIRARALTMKLDIPEGDLQALSEVIFLPGFSTAEKISEYSGRGIGMDAVRSLLVEHQGKIDVIFRQQPSLGPTPVSFVITLPLTVLEARDHLQQSA